MRRFLKISSWLIGGLVLLLVVLGGTVWILGNTDTGRAGIERLVDRLTAGHVKLSGLTGSFPQHLRLQKLQLSDAAGVWLTAEDIALDWSPLAYIEARLQIDSVHAARVDMQRLPQSASNTSSGDVSIPRIDVARLSIDRLQLEAELAGAPATLVAQGSAHLRSVRDMTIEATAHRIDGDGNYQLHLLFDRQHMDASLKLHEPASGPLENILSLPGLGALDATLNLSGARAAERLVLSIQAGGLQGHAQGSLNLNDLSVDLDFAFESSAMNPREDLAWDRAALSGRWVGGIKSPSAKGHLEVSRLRIPGGVQVAALDADGSADLGNALLHGRIDGLRIPGQLQKLLESDPITLEASARLDDAVRRVELTGSHKLFSFRVQAITAGQQSATVELRLPNLAPLAEVGGQKVRGSALINAKLDGYPKATHINLDAAAALDAGEQIWAGAVGARPRLPLSATLHDQTLSIDSLKLTGRSAVLAASGTVNDRGLKGGWNLDVSDMSVVSPIVAGTLKASGTLDGAPAALNAAAKMNSTLSVRGSPSGTLSAELKLRGLPSSPEGTLNAQGSFDDSPLQIEIAAEHGAAGTLHAVIHQASWKSAHLNGDVTVATAGGEVRGRLGVAVDNLKDLQNVLGVNIAGSVKGNISVQPDGQRTRMQLQLDAQSVALANLAGSAHLSGDGFTDSFAFNANVQVPHLSGAAASLSAKGNLNLDARGVMISSASMNYRGQDVRLLSPARISFADGVSIEELKLGAQQAVLTVQGQIVPTLAATASLRQVQPVLVNAFVPNLMAAGSIEANTRLRGTLASPEGELVVDATGIRMADDAALGLPAADFHLSAQLGGDTAVIDAKLAAGSASQINAAGAVPIALDGAVNLKIGGKLDIAMINPFLEARGLRATGELEVDATVVGSVAAPEIGGTVNLAKGSLRDYAHGAGVSNISAQIEGREGALQIKSFTAAAAPGTVSMSGSVGVLQTGLPVDLTITARNAQPIASKLVTANLDADLHVSGTARERLDIVGTMLLNKTLIGIPNALPPNVAVLDVRRRGKTAAPAPTRPLIIGLDVAVRAPQEILVQGRGLDAVMGGDLHFGGTWETPLVSGSFDLQRGGFSLGGARLNFTAGRIGFDGAGLQHKIDPTLDFTAQATVADNTTATMHITGYADAPVFDFSSIPTMPQDEIMSRLLFGVPATSLTALQLAQVGYALASLSGVGGDGTNPLVKVQRSLGLDRLTFGPGTTTTTPTGTDSSGASIEAGKYVSKRVYIEAKQTTAGTSQVGAIVDLTKRLKLQTRLGNGTATVQGTTPENDPGSSIGLVYQFEY